MEIEHKLGDFIPGEPLPARSEHGSIESVLSDNRSVHIIDDIPEKKRIEDELNERVETLLLEKVDTGDKLAIFQLAQFYFEQEDYKRALIYFERIKDTDPQAQFQLGVMYHDGLGTSADHKRGYEFMLQVANNLHPSNQHLIHAAQYNIGRAHFEGCGVKQSDEEAEKWWLLAANDGHPKASIKAQTALGMYYCREESLDLKKALFWHSEATGNGSLESQGALGVMYELGQGCRKNSDSAFECLKEASERGNVYAMGNLASHYYSKKLYTKAAETAARVSQFTDVAGISKETDCLPLFIAKGIAIGSFYYARCLHLGHGVQKDKELAQKYYSQAFQFDGSTTQMLQNMVTHGKI
ncbi:LRP2-binding protein-like [Anneissia japonica]|uniref:LRP2-binding protein-like n=1 Tax=Anneissia japonica TaxID=1529436 RepID=UPI001425881E|nr:LRP2-binding protein-like [Anneissia japonica]XP_033119478.1 LRP2-binding protein-like [Anneissia japonica]XP_033119479.1 LRP2-binding protein-like [Anneissia japonica]XP_033119480.1 LRP2-binding protein-like [Anneissia japonica]XP_033119481.1 LRP2-binding protein-like [Anneissia japonica]XP_033119482.1 LRP2-binding protein-like [Anneissia japonica]